jgi:hypothetical protein
MVLLAILQQPAGLNTFVLVHRPAVNREYTIVNATSVGTHKWNGFNSKANGSNDKMMEDFLISESNSCRYDGINVISECLDISKED